MIDQAVFESRISCLGPFEPRPRLAVGVSGGSDSMALVLLADHWAAVRGGVVTALIVDHGLRKESCQEALQVGRWLKKRGIKCKLLTWEGAKPQSGLMAAARDARYRLMEDWCVQAGVAHLLLAHQLEDQAETFLMRLARGSGVDGLAGMSPILHRRHVRLLRPLLDVPRDALKAYLKAQGQDWIDDPSNGNLAFERVRLRNALPALAELGLSPQRLAASAARLNRVRGHLQAETAQAMARHAALFEVGYAGIERDLLAEPPEIQRRVLAALLTSLSGGAYPPAEDQVEGLRKAMSVPSWHGGTLAGCRLAPRQGRILLVREAAACAPPVRLVPGHKGSWDGRFEFFCQRGRGLWLGALGSRDAANLARTCPELKKLNLPSLVWAALPAIRDARGVFQVPGLGYKRNSRSLEPLADLIFAPSRALCGSNPLLS